MKVKLTKIASTHNNLRTTEIQGTLAYPIEVGESIIIYSEALDGIPDHTRVLRTTPVLRIENTLYYTKNSTYRIEYI